MADPQTTGGSAFFPYHDPFHHHHPPPPPFDQNDEIPILLQWNDPEPEYKNPTIAQFDFAFNGGDSANAAASDHLLRDHVLDEFLNGCSDSGHSRIFPEINDVPQGGGSGVDNPAPIAVLPPEMASSNSPILCNSCQVLREITHTNGLYMLKLQIHGTLWFIAHAVLEKYDLDFSLNPEYQTFDFSKKSTSGVKEFLVQYFEDCKQEGYFVLQDPLLEFYEALSVGDGGSDIMDIDTLFELPPTASGNNQMMMNQFQPTQLPNQMEATQFQFQFQPTQVPNQIEATQLQGADESSSFKPQKIPLSTQRERTGKLKLKDFVEYLHLPIEDAARRMNICPTVMKKICRRDGLVRWPYRKIRSIHRKISNRSKSLSAGTHPEERERAIAEIMELQQQLAAIFQSFLDQ